MAIRGVNILLMGPSGTGKTYSIGTLVDSGVEVFYLSLENGLESLLGYWTDNNKPIPSNLHWHHVENSKASFAELIGAATRINTMNLEMLAKGSDPNKNQYNRFIKLIESLNDFPDDRTGKKFGSVDDFGTDRAIVIDGLTGMGDAALELVIGGKPVKSQSDWGIAQDVVARLLKMLTEQTKCHFILIGHITRETDQVLGGVKIIPSAIGKALGPTLNRMFSDVILAEREGTKFTWNTGDGRADVKSRNLGIKTGLSPNFGALIEVWKKREEAAIGKEEKV